MGIYDSNIHVGHNRFMICNAASPFAVYVATNKSCETTKSLCWAIECIAFELDQCCHLNEYDLAEVLVGCFDFLYVTRWDWEGAEEIRVNECSIASRRLGPEYGIDFKRKEEVKIILKSIIEINPNYCISKKKLKQVTRTPLPAH